MDMSEAKCLLKYLVLFGEEENNDDDDDDDDDDEK